ncbi:MAG: MFS transporter [Mycobacterium sp.]
MLVGFFMILVDSTIVAVANPSIMDSLQTGYDAVIWVTSAYLLAYAVPLLIAGRLGDRFGPKNLYVIGLAVFTVASLWCGFSESIEMLIAARVLQGIGAALLTPQTLSTITRIFPPERRGVAMSVWGATAGVATLVGPLAGGVLVDSLGWQWIFFVNVPIGVIGISLAVWLIPVLPTEKHRFDVLGVLLSGIGMFLIVFGLQEGQSNDWVWWIWALIAAGIAALVAFVYWQAVNPNEPLIPLRIFRDRNFSLANAGAAVIGFVITAFIVPVMFYAQAVCGLSPTRAALLTAPMAVTTGVLAPFVGRIVDRSHPRPVVGFGFSMLAISLTWLSIEMTPTTPIWRLVLPLMGLGVATAFVFAPLAATATRNLAPDVAGAASGVYNATRQVGSVLGSAAIAAFMTAQISAEIPGSAPNRAPEGAVTELPTFLLEPFASALSQSLLLPAFVALFGIIAALFLLGTRSRRAVPARRAVPVVLPPDARTEVIAAIGDDHDAHGDDSFGDGAYGDDDFDDDFADDEYLEVELAAEQVTDQFDLGFHDELRDRLLDGEVTDQIPVRLAHAQADPAPYGRDANFLDEAESDGDVGPYGDAEPYETVGPVFDRESIVVAHNGFRADSGPLQYRQAGGFDALSASFADLVEERDRMSRHRLAEEDSAVRGGRHYRDDTEGRPARGRQSDPSGS